MEERFHKRIQRIKKGGVKIASKEDDEVRILEWNRFNKYVQNSFFEWILNKFEVYTMRYGKILGFSIFEIECFSKYAKPLPRSLDVNSRYNALNICVDFPLGVGPKYECVNFKEHFDVFYRDYNPKDERAHIIVTTLEYPNRTYFKVPKTDYQLYVDNLYALFKAICVGYQYTKEFKSGGGDAYDKTIYECQIDNAIGLKLINFTCLEVRLL